MLIAADEHQSAASEQLIQELPDMETEPLLSQMQNQVVQWESTADRRAIFLSCYCMMTGNMLQGIEAGEFHDRIWVDRLLHRFAEYYFIALNGYEKSASDLPQVWRLAFDASRQPGTQTLQNLLLGVNAHINYDLVLTLAELLDNEWDRLAADMRGQRYADHCHVNDVIGRTIDRVQDQVVEQWTPGLDMVDRLLGPLDEWMTSRLISHWREQVWQNAIKMISLPEMAKRDQFRRQVELDAYRRGEAILGKTGWRTLRDLV
jgi:hypothetical protein